MAEHSQPLAAASSTSATSTSGFIVGMIIPGFFVELHSDWLLCDGSPVPPGYEDLKAALAPISTINGIVYLPNLKQMMLIGADLADTNFDPGSRGGAKSTEVTLTEFNIPTHQHFGWGEAGSTDGFDGKTYKTATGLQVAGAQGHDGDNPLFGSSWWGGQSDGSNCWPTTDAAHPATFFNGSNKTVPVEISLPRPPYLAVNFYIYAGPPKN